MVSEKHDAASKKPDGSLAWERLCITPQEGVTCVGHTSYEHCTEYIFSPETGNSLNPFKTFCVSLVSSDPSWAPLPNAFLSYDGEPHVDAHRDLADGSPQWLWVIAFVVMGALIFAVIIMSFKIANHKRQIAQIITSDFESKLEKTNTKFEEQAAKMTSDFEGKLEEAKKDILTRRSLPNVEERVLETLDELKRAAKAMEKAAGGTDGQKTGKSSGGGKSKGK